MNDLRQTFIAKYLTKLAAGWGDPRHERQGARIECTTDDVYEFVDALAGFAGEPPVKPLQVYGLCFKHVHIGHFPAETAALPMPPIETVCPWCVKSSKAEVAGKFPECNVCPCHPCTCLPETKTGSQS